MGQNIKRGIIGLAVVLFVSGSVLSVIRLLHRTDQEFQAMVFEVTISLDQYPMPFSEPENVRCPPALADGESGTVHLRVTNQSSLPHTLTAEYGTCHVNIQPGETVSTGCTVRVDDASDDYVIVHILTADTVYAMYSPRKALCSIPIANMGSLSGQQAYIVTFLPGLLGMLLGAALWIVGGQAANRSLRLLTVTGLLLGLAVLFDVVAVTLLRDVSLRAIILIALTAGAVLFLAILAVQLVVAGIIYGRRQSED
jgi:hypothetical protein